MGLGQNPYDGRYWWETIAVGTNRMDLAAGPSAKPGVNTATGGLNFDLTLVEGVYFQVEIPRGWAQGRNDGIANLLRPYVRWHKTTSASGNVRWRFGYRRYTPNGTMASSFTNVESHTVGAGTSDTNTALRSLITPLPTIDAAGWLVGDVLVCSLFRVGSDANDTYGADANAMIVGINYARDTPGSQQEYTKT
jgi:hypothetical protein